ncbi:MAG: hypothetical protein NC203_00860 [Firmicutes bacterium]|nr:hypothetical protein [[Eubacterium] siraeum]MCM1486890.1 hypothetical protein [Bacillota bacterium]
MRITVKTAEKSTELVIPTRLLLNRFAVKRLIKHVPENTAENLTPEAAAKLAAELNRFRRRHKHWVLVDVEDGGTGERIVIKL